MTMRDQIVAAMRRVAADSEKQIAEPMEDATPLVTSGLDSLDFAILVAQLERELGDDPFVRLSEPVYPKTLGELVGVYEQHFSNQAG